MAWCCQATSHYLSQCWPISLCLIASLDHNELTYWGMNKLWLIFCTWNLQMDFLKRKSEYFDFKHRSCGLKTLQDLKIRHIGYWNRPCLSCISHCHVWWWSHDTSHQAILRHGADPVCPLFNPLCAKLFMGNKNIYLQGSKFHSSNRLRQVKMTVGQVECLQDLSDGRLHIYDFHISCIGFIYFRQVWHIRTSDFDNPLARRRSAFNTKFRSLIYILWHSSTLTWHRLLKSFLK